MTGQDRDDVGRAWIVFGRIVGDEFTEFTEHDAVPARRLRVVQRLVRCTDDIIGTVVVSRQHRRCPGAHRDDIMRRTRMRHRQVLDRLTHPLRDDDSIVDRSATQDRDELLTAVAGDEIQRPGRTVAQCTRDLTQTIVAGLLISRPTGRRREVPSARVATRVDRGFELGQQSYDRRVVERQYLR